MIDIMIGFIAVVLIIVFIYGGYLLHEDSVLLTPEELESDSQSRYDKKKLLPETWTDKERFEGREYHIDGFVWTEELESDSQSREHHIALTNKCRLTPEELESVQRSNWERLKKEHPAILKEKD